MTDKNIAVIGSTTIDKIIDRRYSRFKAGGATFYSGVTYSRHGIRTLAITNIAARDLQLVERLEKHDIVVCCGRTPQTTRFINDIRKVNRRQCIPQRAAPISRGQIWEHLNDLDLIHLGPLHPEDIDIQAIKSLESLDTDVILDVQGLVRKVEDKNVWLAVTPPLDDALRVSQIVKANKRELTVVLDYFQLDLVTLMRQFNIREFIVTAGADGGFVQATGGAAVPYEAPAAKLRGDPTGAGDIFLAAYAIKRLLTRHSVVNACRYAAKLVTRQIEENFIREVDLEY